MYPLCRRMYLVLTSPSRKLIREITIGTDLDPFNKPEHVHTLKGRELYLFVLFYMIAVFLIVMMFEFFMPISQIVVLWLWLRSPAEKM
ncbi:unnamed protein product [Nippostrongylus brasiliensis]|uniref:NADH-ubiquinone oxidoreductase chain 3 n=1 Tax=Nippostrongylus brasiliensis TaxID=27835 RepID=A0A158QY30_NIPBR|nr:unnamed protein product [Nippostrongylus brasiliensis]